MTVKHIVRFEHNRTKGWLVKPTGHPSKLFSDAKHGGKAEALAAAIAHRDALVGPATADRRGRPRTRFARNTTGTVGVAKDHDKHGKWVGYKAYASLTRGRQTVLRFPFARFGRREAVALPLPSPRVGGGGGARRGGGGGVAEAQGHRAGGGDDLIRARGRPP